MLDAHAIEAFKALAQPTRMALYRLLKSAGADGLSAGAIADRLNVPPPTLSFHLKEMSASGLVSSKRDGRRMIYALNGELVSRLAAFLASAPAPDEETGHVLPFSVANVVRAD